LELTQSNTLLQRQLERAESDLVSARSEGAASYKVLHMIKNPSVDAARERRQKEKERLEQLEIENEELKKRVGRGGGGGGGGENAPVAEQNLVNERLKELFRKNVEQLKKGQRFVFFPCLLYCVPVS
jgi:hypothetical protein